MLKEHIKNDCSNTEINCGECQVGQKRKHFAKHNPEECIQNLHDTLKKRDNEINFLKR